MNNRLADNCTSTTLYGSHSSNTSFIGSLVQTNLQPLMQELANTDAYIESLRPDISRIAYGMLADGLHRGVEHDDLVQEGFIGVWQCIQRFDASKGTTEGAFKSYCLKRARGAMLNFIDKHYRTGGNAANLEPEQWLTVPASTHTSTPTSRKRKALLPLLRRLTQRERLAVIAHYGVPSPVTGKCITRQTLLSNHHFTTNSAYISAKHRAVKKLASMTCPC